MYQNSFDAIFSSSIFYQLFEEIKNEVPISFNFLYFENARLTTAVTTVYSSTPTPKSNFMKYQIKIGSEGWEAWDFIKSYTHVLDMIFHSPPIRVTFKNSILRPSNPLHTTRLGISFCSCLKIGKYFCQFS